MKITSITEIDNLISEYYEKVITLFKTEVVSIYLTGSLSYGDFEPKRSDIDLLTVLNTPATKEQLKHIKIMHIDIEKKYPNWYQRIEASYTPISVLKETLPPNDPRPYFGAGKFYPKANYGNEWIINSYLLQEFGITIYGVSYKNLINPINIIEVQKACIRDLFEEWEPKIRHPQALKNEHIQSYVILNLCRILYTTFNSELSSKNTSSTWVKSTYSPEWRNLIQEAENWRYGKDMNRIEETKEFIKFTIKQIKTSPIYTLI